MSLMTLLLALINLLQPAPHAAVVVSASAASAARGSKVSLYLDVTPNPGVHVYAPGAKDYVPIVVKMDPQSNLTFAELKYPKSEVMEFAGDKVPVYEKAFRLVEDVEIGRGAKAGKTLTLTANVKYQACDDRVCFIPATVPVRWTLTVK
jgi:DsbC/DsbD-like thiol-disulfide interchange protein